jgi:NAD(P)-dependent dehydrogenase (short-subunit alcohol dehydrogenase family)
MLLCGKSAVVAGSTNGIGLDHARAPAPANADIAP